MIKRPEIDPQANDPFLIQVNISNKHLHLTREHVDILFGKDYQLTVRKELTQPGQFAAEETVTLVAPKGSINLRIIGPERKATQVELAQTDARTLGIKAPIRDSGDLAGSAGCKLIGPAGEVEIAEGVIIAKPHVHLSPAQGAELGLHDGDLVDIYFCGIKPLLMYDVLVRCGEKHLRDIHIDTDEGNTAQYCNGQKALVIKHE